MDETTGICRVAARRTDGGPGTLDAAQLDRAADALDRDGAVIVTGAVDADLLGRLDAAMAADLRVLLARPQRAENFAPGHLQQDPPPDDEFLSAALLACSAAVQICRAALRQPLRLSGYSANTNTPGSATQAVHVDEGQRWPDLPRAHPPARLTVNIPLCSADEAQGAIELWPGTHLDTRMCQFAGSAEAGVAQALQYVRAARRAGVENEVNRRVGLTVPEAMLGPRRAERPPVRATTGIGSVLIRDPRLWHRGMPNTTDRARFMLALVFDPPWRSCEQPIELPLAARAVFRSAGLDVCASYVDGPIDHLARHQPPSNSPLRRVAAQPAMG